jgi:hypothetical protein
MRQAGMSKWTVPQIYNNTAPRVLAEPKTQFPDF